MKVKVVEHSAKKYRADSKKDSPGWHQVLGLRNQCNQ
jgi:hypothetical protein